VDFPASNCALNLPLNKKTGGNLEEKMPKNSMKIGGMPPEILEGNESSFNQNFSDMLVFSGRVSFCF